MMVRMNVRVKVTVSMDVMVSEGEGDEVSMVEGQQ